MKALVCQVDSRNYASLISWNDPLFEYDRPLISAFYVWQISEDRIVAERLCH